MDPTVARILDDLKELLPAKAISPAEYLEHSLAHSRASSLEKEVPVKMEALDTEMQEAPVKIEAPVKMEVSSSTKEDVKGVKGGVSEGSSPTKVKKVCPVKEDAVQDRNGVRKDSLGQGQSTEKDLDWNIVKGMRSKSSSGQVRRSTY